MRLVDIDDTSLLKTIADGRLSAKAVWRLIKAQPVVDAVPVIRCKDCVHWEKNNWNPNGMCNAFDDGSVCILTETDADEYCARAERKEE